MISAVRKLEDVKLQLQFHSFFSKITIAIKTQLHKRNKHQSPYNFERLCKAIPALAKAVITNPDGVSTIDFSDATSVKLLNQALLKYHYQVDHWDLPEGYLCPPIPGRADYVHHVADLIAESNPSVLEGRSRQIRCLDIGTGANCIYPILAHRSYGWKFMASDIDERALINAQALVKHNRLLKGAIEFYYQRNRTFILKGVIEPEDYFHAVFCNPPFYTSEEEAQTANIQKNENLHGKKIANRNFGGQSTELHYPGGERAFISAYIRESVTFAQQVGWFTTLVANSENLKPLQQLLHSVQPSDTRVIDLQHGNKKTRVLAWRWEREVV